MKISDIIENTGQVKGLPANPRLIKREKLSSLVQSILLFPEMMLIRPVVVDEDNVCLGGSMRCKSMSEIQLMSKESVEEFLLRNGKSENIETIYPLFDGLIPEGWVVKKENLTLEQKKEFILKDNNQSGMYDFDVLLNDWGKDIIEYCGIDIPNDILKDIKDEDDFVKRFNSVDDSNCVYPIIPKFDERHEVFIIVSDSEVDSNFLRERLNMQKMKSYKSNDTFKSNVVNIKDIINEL
jgi:hypothetical protein